MAQANSSLATAATTLAHSSPPTPTAKASTPTQTVAFTPAKSPKTKPVDMVPTLIHIVAINILANGNRIYHKERGRKSFRMELIIRDSLGMG